MILTTPLKESQVRTLKAGDNVTINGSIFTGRDKIHKYLFDQKPPDEDIPFNLAGGIIYHCGPLVKRIENDGNTEYTFISSGPTTSARLDMYAWKLIKEYEIRAIIGKGGMGPKTIKAMKEHGCVYLHAISGAGVYLADRVKSVTAVWKLEEFGVPEAMWHIEVEYFPAIVTMDSYGNSLHEDIKNTSIEKAKEILSKPLEIK
ncbi:hydro-lyase, Fe-S type, tartrate/fumarate subfamily subunit alpha [Candidatus Magnetoovum chiemensis]|nr:hydro-lyase, Fe-S type, tartrate/fumarate subfamily subunit alpha [Candidatus Magnetoovum chiemensis]